MQLVPRITQRELLTGVLLDLIVGDPQWLPHPVRGIGFLAKHAENFWRATALPVRLAGVFFWCTVVAGTLVCVRLTLPWANIYWIYSLLACRDLDEHASRVIRALNAADLEAARQKLSSIVGRDTAQLPSSEIVRAVVETVAENNSDGVIAPLFYLALAGPLGMAFYKAVNTLDSTVGYRDERYRDFGWWSARTDDILNFIPARLTALVIWGCALLPGYNAIDSVRITFRDGSSQPSPNAGFPEAAFAGALGVQLGGLNHYRGVPSRKPHLGDPIRPLAPGLYKRTRVLLYGSTALFLLLICGSRMLREKPCH